METSKTTELSPADIEIHQAPPNNYQKALTQFIEETSFLLKGQYSLSFEAVCKKGENFVGVLHRCVAANSIGEKFQVILKIPPINEARRKISFAGPFFDREILFYEKVYPMFEKFQNEKGIPQNEMFNNVPKCYKILSGEPNEGIFMEDLKIAGFEIFNRFDDLSADHVKAVMRSLGKFHAISFAVKDQEPALMDPFINIKDVLHQRITNKELSTSTREKLINRAMNAVLESNNEILIEKVKKLLSNDFCELIKQCVDGSNAESYAVLCHGDCYTNNVMFKYDQVST